MIYKTLFQKLDSDVLIKMHNEQSEYPYLIGGIFEELHNNLAVSDLKLSSAVHIFSYSNDTFAPFTEKEFYKLFN